MWRGQREETLTRVSTWTRVGWPPDPPFSQGSGAALDVLAALCSPSPSPGALSLGLGWWGDVEGAGSGGRRAAALPPRSLKGLTGPGEPERARSHPLPNPGNPSVLIEH